MLGDTGYISTLEEYNFHWALRDAMKDDLHKDSVAPQPGHTYIWMDFEDPRPRPGNKTIVRPTRFRLGNLIGGD